MLIALSLKKSSYYSCLRGLKNKNSKERKDIKQAKVIYKIFEYNRKQVGYRFIKKILKKKKRLIWNHKKIKRLMRKFGIIATYVRKMKLKQSLRSRTTYKNYPDLIQRKFKNVTKPLKVFYTDVTYLIYKERKAYQSTIIDGFTKEIIDYKISFRNDNELVLGNLKSALSKIKQINPKFKKAIIHSDHGYQYMSNEFAKICKEENLNISMGAAYTCTDNIVIESFHSLLKKGTIHNNDYDNLEQYIDDVIDWNNWYNKQKNSNFLNFN